MKGALVLSPHPDDEAIGCGGTLRALVEAGDTVAVIFLTSGERGGHGRSAEDTAALREEEARAAAAIIGVTEVEFWREPDGGLQATLSCRKRLRSRLLRLAPSALFVTHDREAHPDHRAAARLALAAVTTLPKNRRPEVLMYEVWTPLERLDHIVDITDQVDCKRAAIRAHRSQCEVLRFDDAALALNRYRGEMHSWPGGEYAEVFRRPST